MFLKCDSSFVIIIIMAFFMHFFGGEFYTWPGFLDARAVFRIVVERVDILIAINFYLYFNLTVQIVRLGDSYRCHWTKEL